MLEGECAFGRGRGNRADDPTAYHAEGILYLRTEARFDYLFNRPEVEKTDQTGRLCRMNLAVHGLEGNIRHGGKVNSHYDDPHHATGQSTLALAA